LPAKHVTGNGQQHRPERKKNRATAVASRTEETGAGNWATTTPDSEPYVLAEPSHPLNPLIGSFSMDSGGWSSIPKLLLIFKVFNTRLCARIYASRIYVMGYTCCCDSDMN